MVEGLLNAKRNTSEKPIDAVYFRAPVTGATGSGPQDIFLWAGLKICGAGRLLQKGVFATIADVTEEGNVTLDNGLILTAAQAVRSLRLCYAITYANCQGRTLPGGVRLDCTGSIYFTLRHLYVGASRCTAHRLLEVV